MWTHLRTFCRDESGDASLQAMFLLAILTVGLTLCWGRLAAGSVSHDLGSSVSGVSACHGQLSGDREAIWRQAAACGIIH